MTEETGRLRLKLEQLVDEFVLAGLAAPEVLAIIEAEIGDMKVLYARDPDPADDPHVVEEPSNDWPGAS
ncbi:hypothetical protein [Rhizobium sp. S163]|uniref:hypothetical protein n=1 Tax=Rhizobium sp. S163 TaxID=3055039 RepID=UPI0025A98E13|nr:hypothetical protein [Rhizobium sp. S163]MDM9646760.1 hypothetical protein [Rhizobium sp. S163]